MVSEIKQFINWVHLRNPHARTWKDYTYDLNLFIQVIGDKAVEEITPQHVSDFIEHMSEDGACVRTINRRIKTVSALFNYLNEEQRDIPNPVLPRLHQLRMPQRLPRPAQQADLELFFSVIKNPRDKAIFTLMLRCGLRISEVAGLTMDNLFLREAKPRIQLFGKNSKERSVYLSPQALRILKSYLVQRPRVADEHVFLSYQLKGLSTTAIHQHLVKYRDLVSIKLTAHQLRHSFATNLIQEKVPLVSVQKLLGHAWIQTTMNYIKVSDPQVQADFFAASARMEGWHL